MWVVCVPSIIYEIVMMKDGKFITFRYLKENGSEKIFEAELLK